MGDRIVDQVAEDHARIRALSEQRANIKAMLDDWKEKGFVTTWLFQRLGTDNIDELKASLAEFENAIGQLEELRAEGRSYQPPGREAQVVTFIAGLNDPMMLLEYRRMFVELKEQITREMEQETATTELRAMETDKEREGLAVKRLELEERERAQKASEARAATVAREEVVRTRGEISSRRLQWSSDLERFLSNLRHRISKDPPAISVDGRSLEDAQWTVQELTGGKGLKASAGPGVGRKDMLLEVEAIEPERLRFPSETQRLLSVPPEAKLTMARTSVLRLYILDTCPDEIVSFARGFVSDAYVPMVLELSSGSILFNEDRRLASLFADYVSGNRSLSAYAILGDFADDQGVIRVEEVATGLGLVEETVVSIAHGLVETERAIIISHDSEYALLDDGEGDKNDTINEKEE